MGWRMTVEANVEKLDRAIELILVREQARHLDEHQRTRLALPALLGTAAECLQADLQRDLASVSSAAIRALTEIRAATNAGRGEQVSSTATAEAAAIAQWLATAADALRSAYARHLVLVAPPAGQDEV